jgi:hypothetical protein
VVLTAGVSSCYAYTREDGLVVTGTTGGGGGAVLNLGAWTGPMLSSSDSADGLAGWSSSINASGKWFGGAGANLAISDNGDWGFTPSISLGWGGGVAVTRDYTWAVDVDSPFPWDW